MATSGPTGSTSTPATGSSSASPRTSPLSEDAPLDPAEEAKFRRDLKFRRRDDFAVELFREAEAHLDDPDRVNRVLLQLSRFYNPYVDQPIVDIPSRRAILEALQAGQIDRAREVLGERLRLYAQSGEADRDPQP